MPITVLLLAAVALTIAVVVGAVWLIRRTVPATREGFHAEISAPMLGVVAALFGLLLAFVIITAYENFIEAGADVNREADSLASIVRDSTAFPEQDGERVRGAVRTYVRTVVDEEWGLMREGRDSLRASRALDGVFAALQAVEPKTPAASRINGINIPGNVSGRRRCPTHSEFRRHTTDAARTCKDQSRPTVSPGG